MFPPCKINLGLTICGKRTDGYHELESIMYQLPFCDVLEIVPADTFSFSSTGLEIPGSENANLCVKAYHLLAEKYDIPPVKIHLHKIIPMGAGLGGGSADGSYTLLLLNKLFKLNLSHDELRDFALKLGSDCPLFIEQYPQLAKGRGEVLSPVSLNLKGYYLQLINIGIHVSTREAFEKLSYAEQTPDLEQLIRLPIEKWRENLKNDFEKPVFAQYPELQEIKEELYRRGAIYASMTGSGSTLFAIFAKKPEVFTNDSTKKYVDKVTIL